MLLADSFYYLHNFQRVLDSVANRYTDLLDESELRFVCGFGQVPQASRALAVRMITRKPSLFLAEDLQYAEIGAVPEAMTALLAEGWVNPDPQLSIDDLFAVFTKPRLLQLLRLPRATSRLTKSALLEQCRSVFTIPQSISGWSRGTALQIYRLEITALCERLRLLYFGNFHQSWSEFVLADLGVRRFEQVSINAARPFNSRLHWRSFEQLHACREMLGAEVRPLQVLSHVPSPIVDCEWLEACRQRLLFRIGQDLERAADPQAALAVYDGISHPGAAVRAIRIRESSEEPGRTLLACDAALESCVFEEDRVLLGRARARLRRRLALAPLPKAVAPELRAAALDMVLDQPAEPYSVERVVGEHLMRQESGSQVYYVENSLLNGLFGLLCWRALFAPIAGAFFHPFHREPADLGEAQFYGRRRQLFAACLAELDVGTYRRTIMANYAMKRGIDNSFVAWPVIRRRVLHAALACIPAPHLKAWFELMARDFRANRCGFPDLIQLWPRQRRYRLIEVKAPGDRLQDNQRRVLSLCADFNMPVAVCKVQWSDRC
jgi:VRR-NUC domain-containing protein/Fanconi-associated nuclease 1-like protein/Fanconi anemia protein nuclease-like protein